MRDGMAVFPYRDFSENYALAEIRLSRDIFFSVFINESRGRVLRREFPDIL
jgi:hypothetical protein